MFLALWVWVVGGVRSPRGPVFAGYDVVAYQSLPSGADGVFGVVDFIAEYANRTWWFASLQNMRLFQADPQRYAPAYGGFCAWGMATEFMPDYPWSWRDPQRDSWRAQCMGPPCDPRVGWAVRAGRLFCSIDRDYMARFLLDPGLEQLADQRWEAWNTPEADGVHFNVDCMQPWEHYTVCWQRALDLGCCRNSTNSYCPQGHAKPS